MCRRTRNSSGYRSVYAFELNGLVSPRLVREQPFVIALTQIKTGTKCILWILNVTTNALFFLT